ncbi:MAG: HD domain-containing phosphohydrolase [candidate division Zixibacteria bacterium]
MMEEKNFDEFTPVNLELLRLGKIPGFDLYIASPNGPVLYRQNDIEFTQENLEALLDNDVKYLYFKNDEEELYFEYIEKNLTHIITDNNVPIIKKATVVYDTSAYLARQMLAEPESEGVVKRASDVLDKIITFTSHDDSTYKNIIQILPTDYYTHTHCANVATYSLALGREIGLTVDTGLWELTLGALLHDVGKAKVPPEILQKIKPLNVLEVSIIKKHVEWGMDIVKNTSVVPYKSYPAIAQHHERLDGSGYPAGTTDINLFGKVVAVADAFDAMTTNRPYARAKSSFYAVSVLKSRHDEYDQSIVKALVEVMAGRINKIEAKV